MAGRISEAGLIVHAFPATLAALETGRIEAGHVRVIAGHGGLIEDDERRARYEQLVLERAETVTPGRLTGFAQRTATRVGQVSFDDRHKAAHDGRCVRIRTLDDGMSELYLYVDTALAAPIWDRLTHQANAITHHPSTTDNPELATAQLAKAAKAAKLTVAVAEATALTRARAAVAALGSCGIRARLIRSAPTWPANYCSPGNPPAIQTHPHAAGAGIRAPGCPWSSRHCHCWATAPMRR